MKKVIKKKIERRIAQIPESKLVKWVSMLEKRTDFFGRENNQIRKKFIDLEERIFELENENKAPLGTEANPRPSKTKVLQNTRCPHCNGVVEIHK